MADSLTHGTRLLGERVTGAKLTAAQVIAILSQPNRSREDLAREYGVEPSNISQILNRKRWKHLATPAQLTEGRIILNGNRGRRGETNTNAKLTAEQVREIRTSEKSVTVLAREYSIAKTTISSIRNRKAWRHIP